jgi:hypothetical protein
MSKFKSKRDTAAVSVVIDEEEYEIPIIEIKVTA